MVRIHFYNVVLTVLCSLVFTLSPAFAQDNGGEAHRVYIGTYTGGGSEGVYLLNFDAKTGDIEVEGLAVETGSPSYLVQHPSLPIIYAAASNDSIRGFTMDPQSGKLSLINEQPTGGKGPCHVDISPDGKRVVASNYSSGSIGVVAVDETGALGESVAFFQHKGSSANTSRQEGPHAHSANFGPMGKYFVAADLGTDELRIYQYDQQSGQVLPHHHPVTSTAPGAGPRHFCFHPNHKFAYVVNELDNTVTGYTWDMIKGTLNPIQTIGTLPEDFTEQNSTAHITVHPSGKYLYASNRGHDSIAVYGINQDTGELTARGQTSTKGKTPRNFAVDPTGQFLLAANQSTNDVVVLKINQEDGTLSSTGKKVSVTNPVCVLFVR